MRQPTEPSSKPPSFQDLNQGLQQKRLRQTKTKQILVFNQAQRAFFKANQSSPGSQLIVFNHQLRLSDLDL